MKSQAGVLQLVVDALLRVFYRRVLGWSDAFRVESELHAYSQSGSQDVARTCNVSILQSGYDAAPTTAAVLVGWNIRFDVDCQLAYLQATVFMVERWFHCSAFRCLSSFRVP